MGNRYAIRHVRNPGKDKMRIPTPPRPLTVLAILGVFTLPLVLAGCSMRLHRDSPKDVRKCCHRLSLQATEMQRFDRYCKVALFLANSTNTKAVGSGVRKSARDAVNVCKFVFRVDTDEELVRAGDEQDYYKVRSYVLPDPADNGGWMHPNCDPAEVHCEEF
jgi:hypothetical protein